MARSQEGPRRILGQGHCAHWVPRTLYEYEDSSEARVALPETKQSVPPQRLS